MSRLSTRPKSRLLAGVVALVALLLAVACGGGSDAPQAATPAGAAPDLSGVTLRVADQVGQNKAVLEASGALKGAPYKIEWSDFSAAAPLLQALRANAADIGGAGDAPVLSSLGSGAPLKVVGASRVSPRGVALLVSKDSPIHSVAELKGKTVSPTTKGSVGHYLLLGALREAGLAPNDVEISFLTPQAAGAAFDSNQIAAWATWDPYIALSEAKGARILRDGSGISAGLGFTVASQQALEDPAKRAAIADFLVRQGRAYAWTNTNKEAFTTLFASLTKLPEPVAATVVGRRNMLAVPIDDTVVKDLQRTADIYTEAGVLDKKLDVASFLVRSLSN
ncbi:MULTISPECIES: ABC transporter substrate-binding protein [Protofrankia]|uniref:Putative aliphatic sulfonates-binding protein n=1 Tax=Candidatus Protofrankia datiscae TaxID=2716812 RepID=F8B3J9_9ACTN|nr:MULTISPECIES: ABC transporter substrate-binding protein [Protofrankia]AEH07836.1 aliphatic sulfonates family ABC transporter, periplasmic ligand-binding protein [Candidatus Protofrankia datiscae]